MNKIYFVTGSQDLYGEETLAQAARDSAKMADFLNEKLSDIAEVVFQPVVKTADEAEDICVRASSDKECLGVIMWMHTFSPAKMWIRALKALKKPMLHLHTQFNEKLPYDSIDMDFMNLNQSAHGDREFGFICTRLGIKREVVAGYYQHEDVIEKIRRFAHAASAVSFSRTLRVAMLGNNMRDVAVTDGDRVESEIRFGWNVNYYGIGDVVEIADSVTESEIDAKMAEYTEKYTMATDNIAAVREQAKYEAALDKFIAREKIGAFTDTFQDLHGLNQLPGIAAQNLMASVRRATTRLRLSARCCSRCLREERAPPDSWRTIPTTSLLARSWSLRRICWRYLRCSRQTSLKFRCTRLVSAGNPTRRALYSTALTARVSRFP